MATAPQDDTEALARRKHADQRRLQQALADMARLLDDDTARGPGGGRSGDTMADTLALVLRAGDIQPPGFKAVTAQDPFEKLQQLARQSQVSMRRVKLDMRHWWLEDTGPLLATIKETAQEVALVPLPAGRGYRLHNLASGESLEVDEKVAARLHDSAWMFLRKFPMRAMKLPDLLRFALNGTQRDAGTLVGAGLLGGLLALFTPFATGLLVDHVIPGARREELLQLVVLLVVSALGVAAFELVRALSLLRMEGRLGIAAEAAVIDRLLHLPAPFFRNYSAGDLAQRAFAINSILHMLTNTVQSAVLSWMFGLFSLFYMFVLNWQLGLVATGLVVLIVAVTACVNLWRLSIERKMYALQGAIASRVLQILNGISKLRSGAAENRAFVLWARDFTRQKELSLQIRSLGNGLAVFNAAFLVAAPAVLFATIVFYQNDISTGVFVAFNAAFLQFLMATLTLAGLLTESLSIIPLYERARPILTTLPEEQESQAQSAPLLGAVEVSRISFRYTEDGPLVLDDLSIKVNKGEFVAFVGASGSGKSTIFRMLLGFEQPQSGAVYYDQQDLASLDAGSVRRQLGVVLQNGKLMPGDIFTNIVGSSPRTMDEAWDAARMAGLDNDIRAMPMGMHTVIAEGAGTISGGQRQRLMIARALVNRPAVLLFDEATSALDNRTQAIVSDSIKALAATRIVIAHRLSTIQQADRILVIDAGKLVEAGSYGELMALNGHFAKLARRQTV